MEELALLHLVAQRPARSARVGCGARALLRDGGGVRLLRRGEPLLEASESSGERDSQRVALSLIISLRRHAGGSLLVHRALDGKHARLHPRLDRIEHGGDALQRRIARRGQRLAQLDHLVLHRGPARSPCLQLRSEAGLQPLRLGAVDIERRRKRRHVVRHGAELVLRPARRRIRGRAAERQRLLQLSKARLVRLLTPRLAVRRLFELERHPLHLRLRVGRAGAARRDLRLKRVDPLPQLAAQDAHILLMSLDKGHGRLHFVQGSTQPGILERVQPDLLVHRREVERLAVHALLQRRHAPLRDAGGRVLLRDQRLRERWIVRGVEAVQSRLGAAEPLLRRCHRRRGRIAEGARGEVGEAHREAHGVAGRRRVRRR
mmetsp:Transcript_26956/g.72360  ORF Transcript_26956/g.72360 Transcript_26956/m.72360 type:complete len:375 (+) Transcript_26956:1589-2713(+)